MCLQTGYNVMKGRVPHRHIYRIILFTVLKMNFLNTFFSLMHKDLNFVYELII